jgi:CRP-like cAMP-binding protein
MYEAIQADFRGYATALGSAANFSAGQVVFRELDPPCFVYFILKGSVEISIRDKVIETVNEGEAVGLLSLIDDRPRTVTARAREDCELALVDKKKFRYMVEEAPHFAWFVFAELGMRLRAANALI